MTGFFCDPTRLFTKPERPLFLRMTMDLRSLPSSEYRLDPYELSPDRSERPPWTFSEMEGSMLLKLADDRSRGLVRRVSVPKLPNGGGTRGRWREGLR